MRYRFLFILGFLFLSSLSPAQKYTKVYLDSSDSTKYYYIVSPDSHAKGLLVLLPGAKGDSEWPLKTSDIPYKAADNGIVTIMIDYEKWLCWMRVDILELLNESIRDVISEHDIPKNKCVIGGFSSGGAIALNYTKLAYSDSNKTAIIPTAAFGLDSPLDLTELFRVDALEVEGFICGGEKIKVSDETRIMLEKMTKHLGTPEDSIGNYYEHSVFIFNERYKNGGTAIHLKDVPVRIYSGIGEKYLINKADCGFYLDSAPYLISFLKHHGNNSATFISQYDEDYQPDGGEKFRGWHAWLGFDSQECIDWILHIFQN